MQRAKEAAESSIAGWTGETVNGTLRRALWAPGLLFVTTDCRRRRLNGPGRPVQTTVPFLTLQSASVLVATGYGATVDAAAANLCDPMGYPTTLEDLIAIHGGPLIDDELVARCQAAADSYAPICPGSITDEESPTP